MDGPGPVAAGTPLERRACPVAAATRPQLATGPVYGSEVEPARMHIGVVLLQGAQVQLTALQGLDRKHSD